MVAAAEAAAAEGVGAGAEAAAAAEGTLAVAWAAAVQFMAAAAEGILAVAWAAAVRFMAAAAEGTSEAAEAAAVDEVAEVAAAVAWASAWAWGLEDAAGAVEVTEAAGNGTRSCSIGSTSASDTGDLLIDVQSSSASRPVTGLGSRWQESETAAEGLYAHSTHSAIFAEVKIDEQLGVIVPRNVSIIAKVVGLDPGATTAIRKW